MTAATDYTDGGFWTPQTSMMRQIADWIRTAPFVCHTALSIDQNPTLDALILEKWPGITIQRAVYPQCDVQKLEQFSDLSFDLVYSHQVLEHVPKPWRAAQQLVRVLKPGGIGLHTT